MQKIETCGPASIVVELERSIYGLTRVIKYAQTDVKKITYAVPNVKN